MVTDNTNKYAEASRLASKFGITLKQIRGRKLELQSDNLQEIAAYAALHASERTSIDVVAEDAGFFVQTLGGFPGPYSSYVHKTIGNLGILRLLGSTSHRTACFRASVAFSSYNKRLTCFSGVVNGRVSLRPAGTRGFGFDPIFIPDGASGRTLAQMGINEKNRISHRARAFAKLFRWVTAQSKLVDELEVIRMANPKQVK